MTPLLTTHYPPSANDRFKEAFGTRVWLALILATLLHVLPFRFFPTMEVEDWTKGVPNVASVIDLPPKADLPDRPEEIQKPGVPVAAPNLDASATMVTIPWDDVPTYTAPPGDRPAAGARDGIPFVPFTVAPKLQNPQEVGRVLEREYPRMLRDAGIGGVVHLLVHIDVLGGVTEARVGTGSGYDGLDEAAMRVAEIMEFSPAMNRDLAVAVWIELPVTFRTR